MAPLVTGALAGLFVVVGMRATEIAAEATRMATPTVSIALARTDEAALSGRDVRAAERHLIRVAISLPGPAAHEDVPIPRRKPSFWGRHQAEEARFPEPPKIAVIVDDMGLNVARSSRVVALGAPLTLSYLPYARNLQRQTAIARAAGHELMVHVPMEPSDGSVEPGPKVLKATLSPTANLGRLKWALSRFDGFVGINNHMGSRFTPDMSSMWPVLRELKRRGLFFVDSLTDRRSAAAQIATAIGLPFAKRDIFLDHVDDPVQIRRRLAELERLARASGAAVAIGHPRDATIAALKEWIPLARARGLEFVPVSQVVQHRHHQLMGNRFLSLPDEGPA